MQNTLELFKDRKEEVDFYYSNMYMVEESNGVFKKSDNTRLIKIMKSNLLLMLYNLIEACIVSGMMEIYERLASDKCSYKLLIDEIQKLWTNHQINEIYGSTASRSDYENRVQQIVQDITSNSPIKLQHKILGINGNLDARKIKEICDSHCISYSPNTRGDWLEKIKRQRNNLTHGDVSFSECAKDLTLEDLRVIKDDVFVFIDDVLNGMKDYYDGKKYRRYVNVNEKVSHAMMNF